MANKAKILKLIDHAKTGGWPGINLSNNDMPSLPPEIAELTHLISLDLSRNQLTRLPPEITRLSKLNSLDLSGNELTSVPPEIASLTSLTSLDLRFNQLTSLPPEIAKLTNLTKLYLNGNDLTTLPPEIVKLTKLTELDLTYNEFRSLPLAITELINLTYLAFEKPRTYILPNRPKVGNRLTTLPPEIARLTNLTHLYVGAVRLRSLPLELTGLRHLIELDLSYNNLTSVPPEITRLTNLKFLDLSGNPLPVSPEALANPEDVKAIFAALVGSVSGERLNEAKMLVVGDGKVGKSSVVERLLYGTYNPQKETTLGVDINDEMKVVQSELKGAGEPVRLNIWDFGGQEIQHSTHQFFMTTRSLYLLVVDARKGDQLANIEYWLKLIESFGGASPIVAVINQIDQLKGQRPLNLDRKALQDKYNIRDFVETSCATGEGIPALNATITREVEQLKHVRDIWPREWLAVKRRLKGMQADYIPVERYLDICAEEELTDEDIQKSLLGLLHDLGVVIRFPGDTQVLNPRWVTQGVYGLLTSAQLVKSQGQLELKDVSGILAGLPDAKERYPSHTHRRLIEVMKDFELCFEFTDRPDHYLIPRHLHDNELDIPWDETDALKFQYRYVETLPDSIISRFIVRMNQYITKQYYWKNGVFLHSDGNRAKVKADLVDRRIFISVIGKEQTRRAFLAVLRSAFDEINSNFKINIEQMIPVPDYPQVMVSYQELLVHEEINEPEIVVPALRKKFPVRELLDGVEESSARMERRERDSGRRRVPQHMPEESQPKPQMPPAAARNNPWVSGSFYLVAFLVALAAIVVTVVVLNTYGVSLATLAVVPIVLIAGLLTIGVVGANQLRNDERLSDESYVKLMIESYKGLPLLRGKDESDKLLKK